MFCDIHQHLIYGVDDGASSCEQMTAMLKRAVETQVDTIVATAHITPGRRPFPFDRYAERIGQARAWCAQSGAELAVLEGAEVFYTPETARLLGEGSVPTLAGGRAVLMEFPLDVSFDDMVKAYRDVGNAGFSVVFAHVERYKALRNRKNMAALHDVYRVKTQMNAQTLLLRKDFFTRRWADWAMREELIDIIASDAHNTGTRACRMKECYELLKQTYGRALALRLCDTAPRETLCPS